MTDKLINEMTASQAVTEITEGRATSEDLVRACLEKIDNRESDVQAWVHVDGARAIAEARAIDASGPKGPLHGLPVGFKDVIDTADMPTAYGSDIYPGHQPDADAACVALIRAAGGVVMGKTVTTEFAFVNPNKTRNPHNLDHTPGGSSSGSAAAVADFMVPLTFGTQTGGSVIRPASFCGVVGYKPSIGQFSYAGVKLLARSLDTLGAFSRSVADLALLRAALLGAPATVQTLSGPPAIALCRTPWWDGADPSSQASVQSAAVRFTSAGANVSELELSANFAGLEDANHTIMIYEGRRSLAHEFARCEKMLSENLKSRMAHGLDISFDDYRAAIELARTCQREFDELAAKFDAILVPSAVGEAPQGLTSTGDATFNRPWTTIGVPCVTLPNTTGRNGLPVGIQLVTPFGTDEKLLSVAVWAEGALLG
jgi:Asp-tRNA(Asn)/Glu-tRNA(Gln) amidotransferase A subunit family amidase